MPRSPTTAAPGNSIALKLTPEVHQTLVNVVATTGRITAAAGKCGLGVRTVRGWLQRGRAEEEGPFHDLAVAIARAKADFVVTAARRLNQLAVGGVIQLPAFDRDNNPIRDKDGALIVTEKAMLPNANALMFILDRVDPQPREPEDGPQFELPPMLSDAEKLAKATAHFDLLVEAVTIMHQLGVPLEQILQPAIETTATAAPAEAEPAKVECAERTPLEPETPTEPPKPDPIEF